MFARRLLAVLLLLSSFAIRGARGEDTSWSLCYHLHNVFCDDCGEDKPEEEKKSYGPCDCQPRKTLMQWSYGTSFSGGAPGWDEPLEADRPGFANSPVTVGRGVVQLETGYTFTLDNSGGQLTINHSFPQALWRIGMFADWFEWRIGYDYEINEATNGNVRQRASGSDDLLLGIKICLTPQEGVLPAMSLVPQMTVPTGAAAFTADQVMPGINWSSEWEFNEFLSLQMATEVDRARDDDGNIFTAFGQSASLGYNFTKKLAGYTEVFVLSPSGHTIEKVQYYADGGFTYHFTKNLQWDIEAGVGLNEAANNFLASTGLVIRI